MARFPTPAGRRRRAVVEWRQDAAHRERTGWYLRVGADEPRRLDVHRSIRALAEDRDCSDAAWNESAATIAALTEALALSRADATGARAELEPRLYELYLDGAVPERLPAVTVDAGSDHPVVTAVLDDAALRLVSRRLSELGSRVVGINAVSMRP